MKTASVIIEEHQRVVAEHEEYMRKLDSHGAAIEEVGLAPKYGKVIFNFFAGKFVNTNADFSTQPKKKENRAK